MNQISVIIPAYQHARTLAPCLRSLMRQSRQPDEIFVVNDGSTDETESVLVPFLSRITVIRQENQGGNAARNRGFAASSGNLILFCDADIVLRPEALREMETALDTHPEASIAYGGFRFGWKSFRSYPFDTERLRQMNFIHTTSLVRRDHFPGFDPSIRRFQDWDVWLTMLEQGRTGVFIDQPLFHVITRGDRPGISQWRPSFVYRIPWECLGWRPASIQRYDAAQEIIRKKHGL